MPIFNFTTVAKIKCCFSPLGVCDQSWHHSRDRLIICGFMSSILPFIYAVVWGLGYVCCTKSEELLYNFMTINVVATVVYSLLDNDYGYKFNKRFANFRSKGIYEHVH